MLMLPVDEQGKEDTHQHKKDNKNRKKDYKKEHKPSLCTVFSSTSSKLTNDKVPVDAVSLASSASAASTSQSAAGLVSSSELPPLTSQGSLQDWSMDEEPLLSTGHQLDLEPRSSDDRELFSIPVIRRSTMRCVPGRLSGLFAVLWDGPICQSLISPMARIGRGRITLGKERTLDPLGKFLWPYLPMIGCQKLEKVVECYPTRSQASCGLKVDQFVTTPKSQSK